MYDLMEPLRPLLDRSVLKFVRSHTFTPSDFVLRIDGTCRLHSGLARQGAEFVTRDVEVRDMVSQTVEKIRLMPPIQEP